MEMLWNIMAQLTYRVAMLEQVNRLALPRSPPGGSAARLFQSVHSFNFRSQPPQSHLVLTDHAGASRRCPQKLSSDSYFAKCASLKNLFRVVAKTAQLSSLDGLCPLCPASALVHESSVTLTTRAAVTIPVLPSGAHPSPRYIPIQGMT